MNIAYSLCIQEGRSEQQGSQSAYALILVQKYSSLHLGVRYKFVGYFFLGNFTSKVHTYNNYCQ